jgi:alpha-amylase
MVVNHMTGSGGSGTGSAGSSFNAPTLTFPSYSSNDFNCCNAFGAGNCASGAKCYTSNCDIGNYGNPQEVCLL